MNHRYQIELLQDRLNILIDEHDQLLSQMFSISTDSTKSLLLEKLSIIKDRLFSIQNSGTFAPSFLEPVNEGKGNS